jgi:hypothetical protein
MIWVFPEYGGQVAWKIGGFWMGTTVRRMGSPWNHERSRSPAALHRVIVHLDIDAEAACASVGQRATGVERQAGPFRFPTPQATKL